MSGKHTVAKNVEIALLGKERLITEAESAAIIKAAKSDVVTLQEVRDAMSASAMLANEFGSHINARTRKAADNSVRINAVFRILQSRFDAQKKK